MGRNTETSSGVTRRAVLRGLAAPALVPTMINTLSARDSTVPTGAPAVDRDRVTRAVTTSGPVRGYVSGSIHTFKGIPYGRPPTGALRFKASLPPEPWREVRDATRFGPAAPQMPLPSRMTLERARIDGPFAAVSPTIFISPMAPDQSEGCLVLNVWTPGVNDGGKRAVLFRIHGGGFIAQSAAEPWYDGTNIARRGDIVVVSPNHRLNALGYLYLGEAMGGEYAAGNPGMMDLVLALKWVRDNIAGFGGDPDKVTICGESGGGAKVSTLLAMPAATGLFKHAIIESGPNHGISREQASDYARRFLSNAGVTRGDTAKLQALPVEALFDAQIATGGGVEAVGPCIEGVTLPRGTADALAAGMSSDVPFIIGSTRDEGRTMHAANLALISRMDEATLSAGIRKVFGSHADGLIQAYKRSWPEASPGELFILIEAASAMRRDSWQLAEARLGSGGAPVFMYMLEWESGAFNGMLLAGHGLDAPLTMDNYEISGPWTADYPTSRIVAASMSEAWIAFVKTGNPGAGGRAAWPAYELQSRETMLFNVESRAVKDPYGERAIWEGMPRAATLMFPVPGAAEPDVLEKLKGS